MLEFQQLMSNDLTSINELLRLEDLLSYAILDTEEEKQFNDLLELAGLICGCRIATISFVDKHRQWFKAKQNISVNETDRDISFCSHTILGNEVMVVENASADSRFCSSPLVKDKNIQFYAGAPIRSSAGYNIGSVCVMDNIPNKSLSVEQKEALMKIANQITCLLELRVRNRLIVRQAESLLQLEKKITRLLITEQESERKYIAHELHENFAQTLAAIKLNIEFAEQSHDKSGHFIQKSKDNLVQIIRELRNLSNSMVTTKLDEAVYGVYYQTSTTI